MIFVSGVAARWLELYYEGEDLGPGAAAALVGRIARSALTGTRLARELFERRRVAISVDGEGLADAESFTVMGASTVRDIGLGFRPFRTAGSRPRADPLPVHRRGPAAGLPGAPVPAAGPPRPRDLPPPLPGEDGRAALRARPKRGAWTPTCSRPPRPCGSPPGRKCASSRTRLFPRACADVAQLVEQLIRNQQVPGSSPGVGSDSPGISGTSEVAGICSGLPS